MNEPTPDDARKRNEALRRLTDMDRREVDQLTTELRTEANRNHFAERLHLAFSARRHA